MEKPEFVIDIFLQPGEFFFGDHETRIRTLLGSCVSMTFWHPQKLIGGMSHIILPTRTTRPKKLSDEPTATDAQYDAKYADELIHLAMQEIKAAGTAPKDYVVKVFGGGNMFLKQTHQGTKENIGQKNSDATEALLKKYGFKVHAMHVGGNGHRSLMFDVWSGDVWMKYQEVRQSVAA